MNSSSDSEKTKGAARRASQQNSSRVPSGSRAGASDELTRALVVLAAAGGSVPCGKYGEHELWFSSVPEERQIAASRCLECRVLVECGRAAHEQDEQHGVWGGVDRTKLPKRKAA